MKKKVLVLATILSLGMTVQAFACTPPLNPPSSPHIEFEWTPSEEFQKGIEYGVNQYLKDHPIELPETETETETEESIKNDHVFDWRDYIPECLKAHWRNVIRR